MIVYYFWMIAFFANKLSLSLYKTSYSICGKFTHNNFTFNVQLCNTDIKQANCCKYLGLFSTINWLLTRCSLIAETMLQGALYTVFQKSDAKIQITITTAYLIRIKYPLSSINYHLSDINIANFNKIYRTVSKQQLF